MKDAVLLVDRFVSASSATDAHDALQALLEALTSKETDERIDADAIWHDDAFLEALLQVLVTASFQQNIPLEEGPALVCRIYQQLWKADGAANILVKHPSPGKLVQSLVDVASDTNSSDYTRVLALQVLNDTCTKAPSTAQTQLLEIPNGLHRLADVFQEENDQVRNELLGGVAQTIARWPSCAKIWTFSEVCDVLLGICMQEGGLTRGPVLVRDCLMLVESLVDPTLADLLWQSRTFAPTLAGLLDLRRGTEFLHPPKPTVSQTDDLDAILASGNHAKQQEATTRVLPKLTFNEEDVVLKVLNILSILLESPSDRPVVWKQHAPLCSLVWELALVTPPPSGTKPGCALPSARLQQLALETTAQYFSDAVSMNQHHGLDRLLYLVCTGGGGTTPSKWNERLGLSQAALHVLRQTLPPDEARELLTHTLAPPPASDNDQQAPSATAVQRLLNTVFENMETTSDNNELERRRINLLGALGALSVFLQSPTDREVLMGITSSTALVNAILECLEQQEDEVIQLALLRFACEWVVDAPAVVQAFLASSHSIVLTALVGVTAANKSTTATSVRTMSAFFLGLVLEYMPNDNDDKHGGWTKQSIMELLSKRKGGISGYTTALEGLKTADLPWKACALEWQHFLRWYSAEVLAIRQCVVKELTNVGGDDDVDDDEVNRGSSNVGASTKSLNRLVSQQAKELEEMRESLNEAKATIESQEGQLSVWKRRVESNPTQLDDLLTEYTNKTAELEKEMSAMKKRQQDKEASLQRQLEERDNQIVQLQAMVQEWQDRELEARQERDDLRGELQGLSSAYNTLEQEFNRRDDPNMHVSTAAAPAGEASDARPAQQPEGEVSHQEHSSSPELASLRAENARLRSDAQAADDWMAMAVERMNDIGGQNQTLQQEVEALRGQLQQAQLAGGVVVPPDRRDEERQYREQLTEQLNEARHMNSRLEVEISSLRQKLDANSAQALDTSVVEDLKRRLSDEENRRLQVETQLKNAQQDTSAAMDSLGGSKSEKERLERIVANMEVELQNARSEIAHKSVNVDSSLNEMNALVAAKDNELETMRSLLASRDEELMGLRQHAIELREDAASQLEDKNLQEISSLRENVAELTDSLEKTRKEFDESKNRAQEELRRRDERIHELETVASQDVPGSDSRLGDREEEIMSLRRANEEAHEWISKAVEHHKMLSEQVSALTEDKVELTKEIKELQQKQQSGSAITGQSQSDSSREIIERLERDLADRTSEVTDLGAHVIKLESEVRIKETEMMDVQEKVALCEQLQKQVEELQNMRDKELEKTRLLEDKISHASAEKDDLATKLDGLRQELEAREDSIAYSLDKPSDEVASLTALLDKRDNETKKLQEELKNLTRASSDADELRVALQNATDERSRLQADLEEVQLRLKDKISSFEQLQVEVEILRDESSKTETHRRDIDEADSVVIERDDLKQKVSNLEAQLSEFQTWANAAQQKIAELQNEKAALEKATKTASESVSSDLDLSSVILERENLKERVATLETQLSEFKSWSDAAQLKIVELQNEKEALEQGTKPPLHSVDAADPRDEVAFLTAERDCLKNTVKELEARLSTQQSRSDAAQKEIEELQDGKDAIEQKLSALAESERIAREELDSLREKMEAKSSELSSVLAENEELSKAKRTLESESETMERIRDEIASSQNHVSSLTSERDSLKVTVGEMEEKLSEFQLWSDTAQAKIKELQDVNDDLEHKMMMLAESEKEDRALLDSTRDEMEAKSTELEIALAENEELKTAKKLLESDNERFERLNDQIASSERQVASLSSERETLEATISELEEQLTDLQSRSDTAELRMTELQNDKAALEQEVLALTESESGGKEELDALREEVEAKSTELSHALKKYDELKATNTDLASQLSNANLENDDTFGKIANLERDVKDFEAKCCDLIERANKADVLLAEKEESLRATEENAATLQSSLELIQNQSTDVIGEWKAQVETLESTIAELEAALQQQQVEASDAVEQWSMRWSELDSLRTELEMDLENVSKERDELKHKQENEANDVLAQFEVERGKERAEWDAERERLQARIDEQNESLISNTKNLEAADEELSQMRTSAAETIDAWKNRVKEMEGTIEELEQVITQRREEAAYAIAQWESHCNKVEERAAELEMELDSVAKENDDYRANMEKSIEPLAEQLEEERAARKSLEEENEAVIQQIETMKVQSEDVVNQWKGRVEELETGVSELEDQLVVQQEEATKAISQWEATCSALELKANQLEMDVEESVSVLRSALYSRRALAAKMLSKLGQDAVTMGLVQATPTGDNPSEDIASFHAMFNTSGEILSNAIDSLIAERASKASDTCRPPEEDRQDQIDTLKQQIKILEEKLVDQTTTREQVLDLEIKLEAETHTLRATEASLKTERELAETLQVELLQLRQEIESNSAETQANLAIERAARESAERNLAALQETVSETEEAFMDLASKEEKMFSESSHTKEDLEKMQQLLQTRESEWQGEREILEQERDDLKATIGELQEELRDASDALQACVTDAVSEKATEVASQALRYQMEQLRSQITQYTEACATERNARLAAEKEVEALQGDLANVLGVFNGDGDASSRVQRMTMQASEAMQRRECEEIESIRKALERALQELESAQAAERKAAEDAAASRLQLSNCEQEVLVAKSDLAFLTQTLEESREAEASKAASLEYRISSLEDDREVLRQFHQDELENLRNELTHVTMEKDRIMHSLKESEKKNTALVFSNSKEREFDGSASPEAELSRLRIEKAQLLTAAAEEGSRTERRIREAVAAQVSSMEADVILERELRVAAEATVEDIKFQMQELKSEAVSGEDKNNNESRSESFIDELSTELKRFKEETRSLSAENSALRKELEAANENSRDEVAKLSEKYRKAQAKAQMLAASDRFEAEVNVEVAKLRSNGGGSEDQRNWIVVRDNPAYDQSNITTGLSPVEAYDMIQQQAIAIQEERAMYLELLAEHDDLLALLAQQDLEKASLNVALAHVAGQEAVTAAYKEAEEAAVRRYGKYVKLTPS